mmetsp:Transcript_16426/g.20132  ORF Transcript_16426/g.20132 Transcript_16426/m.20132 type:complete len:586 (-) Transcript_16426:896-2653(-)
MKINLKRVSIVFTALIVCATLLTTIIISTDSVLVSSRVTNYQDKVSSTHILFLSDTAKIIGIFAEVAVYAQFGRCESMPRTKNTSSFIMEGVENAVIGVSSTLEQNIDRLDALESKWKRIKKGRAMHYALKKKSIDAKIQSYRNELEQLSHFILYLKNVAINDTQAFYEIATGLGVNDPGWDILVSPSNNAYDRLRRSLSKTEKESRDLNFCTSVFAFIIILLSITLLTITQLRLADAKYKTNEAEAKVDAQERLVRQQAHEVRSRFAPAITLMSAFLDANSFEDYQSLRPDMATALTVLKEVEYHQKIRLDVYKILKGNYEMNFQIFDILLFLHQRCAAEQTIARLTQKPSTTKIINEQVQFCVGFPIIKTSNIQEEHDESFNTKEIIVKTDVYILTHILNNLLSNARKHTHNGSITVYFLGCAHDKLFFRVSDTGVGIPFAIRDQLFCDADVARADLRGTGLGLSSCEVFARAAGGYIRLVKTVVQDATNEHGSTVFEFCLNGQVIHNDDELFNYAYDPEIAIALNYSPFIIQQAHFTSNDHTTISQQSSELPSSSSDLNFDVSAAPQTSSKIDQTSPLIDQE